MKTPLFHRARGLLLILSVFLFVAALSLSWPHAQGDTYVVITQAAGGGDRYLNLPQGDTSPGAVRDAAMTDNLLSDGDFTSETLTHWTVGKGLTASVIDGALHFTDHKTSKREIRQDITTAFQKASPFELRFDVHNSAAVRKLLKVQVQSIGGKNASSFACVFNLPKADQSADTAMTYVVRGKNTTRWTKLRLRFMLTQAALGQGDIILDNISLVSDPSLNVKQVECPGESEELIANGEFNFPDGDLSPQSGYSLNDMAAMVVDNALALQNTGDTPLMRQYLGVRPKAGKQLTLKLQMSNTGNADKLIKLRLVGETSRGKETLVCTFNVPAHSTPGLYKLRGMPRFNWSQAQVEIKPPKNNSDGALIVDSLSLMVSSGQSKTLNCTFPPATVPPTATPTATSTATATATATATHTPTATPTLTPIDLCNAESPGRQHFCIAFDEVVSDGVPRSGAGQFTDDNYGDIFYFDAEPGQAIWLDWLGDLDNSDTNPYLYDPDGKRIYAQGLGPREWTVKIERGGRHALEVRRSAAPPLFYSFSLHVSSKDYIPLTSGLHVSSNVPVPGAGRIERPGSRDLYTFDAYTGQSITFNNVSTGNAMRWTIYDPDGRVFFNQVDGINWHNPLPITKSGRYVLLAENGYASTGSYSFTFEQTPEIIGIPTPEWQSLLIFPITLPVYVTENSPEIGMGYLEDNAALDRYSFAGEAGDRVSFQNVSGGQWWRLIDPDGVALFDEPLQPRSVVLPLSGEYRLVVYKTAGSYAFDLETASDQTFTIPFPFTASPNAPETGMGQLETQGAFDRYTFTLWSPISTQFDLLNSGGQLLRLIDVYGLPIGTETYTGTTYHYLQAGTYTAIVHGAGTYTFQIKEAPSEGN